MKHFPGLKFHWDYKKKYGVSSNQDITFGGVKWGTRLLIGLYFTHVYMAIILFISGVYTHEAMKNYRSLEAHRYFTAGFVGAVRHHITEHESIVFRADVRPSQRANDPSHQPWVATNKDGEVLAGHCTCMAG